MPIVDSQIHLWENARMSPQHRQIPTYNVDDALKEMAEAGVDAAVIHPPSTLGEAPNVQAVEAVKAYPSKFCILGNFDLQAPNKEDIVKNWRQRPGMLGFRFTFNQPHQQSWWGTDITRMPCSYRQCVTMFTEELPWLQGRDKDLVMGQAIIDWLGWKRPA